MRIYWQLQFLGQTFLYLGGGRHGAPRALFCFSVYALEEELPLRLLRSPFGGLFPRTPLLRQTAKAGSGDVTKRGAGPWTLMQVPAPTRSSPMQVQSSRQGNGEAFSPISEIDLHQSAVKQQPASSGHTACTYLY